MHPQADENKSQFLDIIHESDKMLLGKSASSFLAQQTTDYEEIDDSIDNPFNVLIRSFKYPDGCPEDIPITIDDLPPTSNISDWRKLSRPDKLVKILAKKELTIDISYEYVAALKKPIVLKTNIGELKKC